jgi:hypothetical protein
MTESREWISARLVRAALDVPTRTRAIGEAIWLYLHLLLHVGHDGRLCRKSERIAADLSIREAEVETWLARLVEAGLVIILSPSPFLVIKLPLWSGSSGNQALIRGDSEDGYSSRAIAAITNQGEKGGQGEGEGLLREILNTLGESDPEPFRKVVERFSPAVVQQALARVRAARPDQIRKSRTALFRFLIGRLSKPPTP